MDFTAFLAEQHSKSIAGTENDRLDDDLQDAFDAWMEDMDQDTLIKYADLYTQTMYNKGYADAMERAIKIIGEAKI
jgi:hypothetical protein